MVNRASREVTEHIADWIEKVTDELGDEQRSFDQAERSFFHYASVESLFSILESDTLWLTNMRFSNDGSEGTVLIDKGIEELDNYIGCFCDNGDLLSQWRGYCPKGGASIEMELNEIETYSVLKANYDTTGEYITYVNLPLPVLYVKNDPKQLAIAIDTIEKTGVALAEEKSETFETFETFETSETSETQETPETPETHDAASSTKKWKESETPELRDIIPFLKNDKFKEERESRLVFSNAEEKISECIRFRKLQNGAKTPYIVVKFGDIGKNCGTSSFDASEVNGDFLKKKHDKLEYSLWIPEGNDQKSKYNIIRNVVKEYNRKQQDSLTHIHVYCKGHLPIKSITISPMLGQDRLREQVERFCVSKYWLRDVTVKCSEIPYISSL